LQEVKEYGEILRGLRYIELLVECDERLTDQYIHVDSDRLRELLICLMSFTICSLDTGAVTLVASRIGTEGIEHVEFLIGHHGYYSEGALLGSGNESNNYTVGPLEITLAQKLAVALGGSVTVEREGRNLPVFVVSIPAVV
jgi:hypothetical protein